MEWLNINVADLDSPAFVGATPTERATWLCLLRFCVGQENGGRILECSEWGDAKWQQMCRVKLKEVREPTELWYWEEFNLVVNFYPKKQETKVRKNRTNGYKGGRPKKMRNNHMGGHVPNPNESKCHNVKEGKGREEEEKRNSKGKEGNETAAGQASPVPVSLTAALPIDPSHGRPELALQMIETFSKEGAYIVDVLRFFRVPNEIKGDPVEGEWREATSGQSPRDVAIIFYLNPVGFIRMPSQYRKARRFYESTQAQGAA